MVLQEPGSLLEEREVPTPSPGPDEVLVRMEACGVCRTDLHVVDGELTEPRLPLVPGHQVVGSIERVGSEVAGLAPGSRVGIPWLARTCGRCRPCEAGRENLCEAAEFTGYTRDGGFADFATASASAVLPIPSAFEPVAAAPLLCAGLIGYRAYQIAGPAERLGLYGFGAAAHLLTQLAVHEGRRVFAFTREGDSRGQEFARSLGAVWAGESRQQPPETLDSAIIFAPVGALVPLALQAVGPGGSVVCAGIHMSEIPSFPYRILWEERVLRSVANLTREDGRRYMEIAPTIPVQASTEVIPLAQANVALERLREGSVEGALVLVP